MIEKIKCLVWDLDNTLWKGTVLEKGACRLQPGIRDIIRELDNRGILMSIASSNDRDLAEPILKKKGIFRYFLHPQISWANKVSSIKIIADKLKIALNSLGFIDDEPYEREQVRQLLPMVRTYDSKDYKQLLDGLEFNPQFISDESKRRREMYLHETQRIQKEEQFKRTQKDFLKYCETHLTLRLAQKNDLPRILELMHRTHQLNATGKVYTPEQIESFLEDGHYHVYVAELRDRFVDYGKIGVAIIRCFPERWELFSFFLSCRVLTRGIGNVFISWLQNEAFKCGAENFEGHFMKQERNHRMFLLYSMSGFKPIKPQQDGSVTYSKPCLRTLKVPEWLHLE
jgi:FkbH-like protein